MKFLHDIRLIQGGMGIYISNWRLARSASMARPGITAGTLSSAALEVVYPRILQLGDPGGHVKRAFYSFDQTFDVSIGEKFYQRYHIPGGKKPEDRFKSHPMPLLKGSDGTTRFPQGEGTVELTLPEEMIELSILAGYAETWLAKEGHNGVIFMNFLHKIELSLIYIMYGAMLAGIDGIVVGAGNPDGLPLVMDQMANHLEVEFEPSVLYKEVGERFVLKFDPSKVAQGHLVKQNIQRPSFLGIVSLQDLAQSLAESSTMAPDGLVVENYRAGGHNANPSGPLKKDELGQPIYGERDIADLEAIKATGLPFWLAGGFDSREKLQQARKDGATGVQAGTIFALSEESGMRLDHRYAIFEALKKWNDDSSIVRTTMMSPTGFAFKVARLAGSLSDEVIYMARRRVCDIGLLMKAGFSKPDINGIRKLFQRCPAGPVESFISKRGLERNTQDKACICNGLLSGAGLAQTVKDFTGKYVVEPSIVTLGQCLDGLRRLSRNGQYRFWCEDIALDILG